MTRYILTLLYFIFALGSDVFADDAKPSMGLTVDLKEPVYVDGVLTTDQGGVVSGPSFRLQAQHIRYIRQLEGSPPTHSIEAHGSLMLEYGPHLLIGDQVVYDFLSESGTLIDGRTGQEPWFIGGQEIRLLADRTLWIDDAFLSTCDNYNSEWQIRSSCAHISNCNILHAQNIQFCFVKLPVFWVPSFRANIEAIFDSPVKYKFGFGGSNGFRVSARYRLFQFGESFRTFIRGDWRSRKGPGIGVETEYLSENRKSMFNTRNYIANDGSLFDPNQDLRYRIQGELHSVSEDCSLSVDLQYDKISDEDMPSDYEERDFNLQTTERTELFVRKQTCDWIANVIVRGRLNSFQTVKQELPTLKLHRRPFLFDRLGIIADGTFSAGYLDYKFAKRLNSNTDYNAARFHFHPRFYRPIHWKPLTVTPEVGIRTIYWGNTPSGEEKWEALGVFGVEGRTHFHKFSGPSSSTKHLLSPFVRYDHITTPLVNPDNHYVFDIDDGWYTLNMLTVGVEHNTYRYRDACYPQQWLMAKVWTHAFIEERSLSRSIPKMYTDITWHPTTQFTTRLKAGWNIPHSILDFTNFRVEWTLFRDLAFSAEYRYRSRYDWRKSDRTNFIVDMYRTESELLASPMSDRRDTFLFHMFYRMKPDWDFEIQARHGWARHTEPSYYEYEASMTTVMRCAWKVRFAFQHREHDDRASVYITLKDSKPRCVPRFTPTWTR